MGEEIRTKLFQEVVNFARTSCPDEIDKAYEFFFDEDEPESFISGIALDLAFINFEDWLACDYRNPEGEGVIDLMIRADKGMEAGRAANLTTMKDSVLSLYEIISSGEQTHLIDLLRNTEITSEEDSLSTLAPGDVFATRFFDAPGGREMSRCVYPFGAAFRDDVLKYVNIQVQRYVKHKNPEGSLKDFLREESCVFNIIWINSLHTRSAGDEEKSA